MLRLCIISQRDSVSPWMAVNRSARAGFLLPIIREDCSESLDSALVAGIQQGEDDVDISVTQAPVMQEFPGIRGFRRLRLRTSDARDDI